MREFSLIEFAEHLVKLQAGFHVAVTHGLEGALKLLKEDMVAQVGHYQDGPGPYAAWVALTDATEEEKAKLGAPANAPLEREGDLKASFKYETEGLEGIVGSTDPVMVYHEFGTATLPPRPIVGPALYKHRAKIQAIAAQATIEALIGGKLTSELEAHFGDIE